MWLKIKYTVGCEIKYTVCCEEACSLLRGGVLVGCVLNELCVFQVLFLLCAVKCIVRDLPCDWPSLLRCCVVVSPQKKNANKGGNWQGALWNLLEALPP